jgi:hypothetical protein
MCMKGRIGLKCLTPFEKFVEPIGGPLGFVLLCFGVILLVFASYGILSYTNQGRSHTKSIWERRQYQALRLKKKAA